MRSTHRFKSLAALSIMTLLTLHLNIYWPAVTYATPLTQTPLSGQVAYIADGEIWLLDLSSGATRQITSGAMIRTDGLPGISRIAWSPDGSKLAFVRFDDFDRSFISVITPDGTEIDSTITIVESTYAPTFTRGGDLAFVREIAPWDGNAYGGASHQGVRRDQNGFEQLLFEYVDSTCEPSRLSFSATDELVVTEECRMSVTASLMRNGETVLFPPLDTVGVCGAPIGRDYYARDAVWARQQPLLAIIGGDCATPDDYDWKDAIYLIDTTQLDSPARKLLAGNGRTINALDWSPDDSWLIYDSTDGLWALNIASGEHIQVSPIGAYPAWQPGAATSTPEPTIDADQARAQLEELRAAIERLERVELNTGILGLTITAESFDQQAARNLLNRAEQLVDEGTLTPAQLDALARLTMADLALAQVRDDYVVISTATSDLIVDVAKLPLAFQGLASKIKVNDACRTSPGLCGKALEGLQNAAWSAAANMATPLIRLLPFEDRDLVDQEWRLLLAAEKMRFTGSPKSLAEWFGDQTLTKALAGVLQRVHFHHKLQPVADQAVRSADISVDETERWVITHDLESSRIFVDGYLRNSQNDRSYIAREFEDLSQRTEYLEMAESLTGLGGFFAPVLFKFKAALAVGRSVGLAELVRSTYAPALNCQAFRAEQVLQRSFDRGQFEECKGPSGYQTLQPYYAQSVGGPRLAAPQLAPMQLRLLQDAAAYRQAVEALVPALLADDQIRAAPLLAELVAAAENQQMNLEVSRAIILAQPQPDSAEALLADGAGLFASNNVALYLAILETALARAEGNAPQTDLAAAAATAVADLQALEDAAAQVNLEPPGVALPRIASAALDTRDGKAVVAVTLVNVGAADAAGLALELRDSEQRLVGSADLPPVAAGAQQVFELPLSAQAPLSLTLQLNDSSGIVSVWVIEVPVVIEPVLPPTVAPTTVVPTVVAATPIVASAAPGEATRTPPTPGRGGNGGVYLLGFVFLLLLVVGGVILLRSRRR